MTPKRPSRAPRQGKKKSKKRGQPDRLAVLYFFLGLVVAAALIYFGQSMLGGLRHPQLVKGLTTKPEPMLALVLDPAGGDQEQLRDIQSLKLPITLLPAQGLPRNREVQDLMAQAVLLDGEPGAQAALWRLRRPRARLWPMAGPWPLPTVRPKPPLPCPPGAYAAMGG